MSTEIFTKPGAYVAVSAEEQKVYKRMPHKEQLAYEYLDSNREALRCSPAKIRFPQVIKFRNAPELTEISYLGEFPNTTPRQYFGEWEGYSTAYLELLTQSFADIRTLPTDSLPMQEDYESTYNGVPSSLLYLARGISSQTSPLNYSQYQKIARQAMKTQLDLKDLPQYPAHRDPNPNNYMVDNSEGTGIAIIDWETFGLSRSGYDEARLCTYLSLNENLQEHYLQSLRDSIIKEPVSALYFWRVAAVRGLREITSFESGHYGSRLCIANETGEAVVKALSLFVERAISETDSIIG